jgi:Cu(I)/Ag(I) efflux system membrane protein CusA/SilA
MLAAIIRWSSRNVLLILMATAFVAAAGVYALLQTPLDAIPDLSDPQVIVYTEYPGQAPQVVEDQITYPLTTALLAVPRAKVVRGFSFFGASFVYVVFTDGTDIYWARSRVLEYLNFAQKRLPAGVTPSLGPDATGVGWVFEYAVLGAKQTLAELRTVQDWFIRYQLTKAEGVAEVASVGGFVQVVVDRYGLTIKDVLEVVQTALGGEMVTTTVEGRERFSVNVRYPRGLRDHPQAIASQVLVNGSDGTAIPLGQIAAISIVQGAPSIRTENAQLVDYIYVDLQGRDLGGYVADAQRAVRDQVKLPAGYHVEWSGQFEYLQRAKAKLQTVVPLTLFLIFLLLFLNFQRLTETLIVMLSVPFALTGGLWLMYLLGFNMSVAVAVGFIALAGVAAETGVVMLIYLDHAFTAMVEEHQKDGRPLTERDLYAAIIEGAVERVRPKMMTVSAIMASLLPILWSTGTGSEVMRRIAVPMVGGMVSSTVLTLLVIPAIYAIAKGWRLTRPASSPLPSKATVPSAAK